MEDNTEFLVFEAHSLQLPLIMSYTLDFPLLNSTSPALYVLPPGGGEEEGVLLYNPYSSNNTAIGTVWSLRLDQNYVTSMTFFDKAAAASIFRSKKTWNVDNSDQIPWNWSNPWMKTNDLFKIILIMERLDRKTEVCFGNCIYIIWCVGSFPTGSFPTVGNMLVGF